MTGRRLLGWITVAVLAMCGTILATTSPRDEAVHAIIRWTARSSFVLFALAYAARPATQLWPGARTKQLLRERKWLGIGFAVSHAFHLAGIIALAAPDPSGFVRAQPPSNAIALVMFLLLFAMAITSIEAVKVKLSSRSWKRLHRAGMHLAWLIFATSYGGRALASPPFAGFVVVLLAIAAMRCAVWLRRHRIRPQLQAA